MRTKTKRTAQYEFDRRYGEKTRRKIDRYSRLGFYACEIAKILKGGYLIDICLQDILYWNKKEVFNKLNIKK
jgi:hypothetical protein